MSVDKVGQGREYESKIRWRNSKTLLGKNKTRQDKHETHEPVNNE